MTNTVSDDSVDPTADQQTRRPDELEDWLSDLRVTLSDDSPDWLARGDVTADPASDPATPGPATPSQSTEDRPMPDTGPPAQSGRLDRHVKDDRPSPAVGRHRAAE